jgi:hypothetical protein
MSYGKPEKNSTSRRLTAFEFGEIPLSQNSWRATKSLKGTVGTVRCG